jgi:hypothetical protein
MGSMDEIVASIFQNPETAIPAWIVTLAVFATVVEFLARGHTGKAVREWFKGRKSQTDVLFTILREAIEEQAHDSDKIEELVCKVQETILSKLEASDKSLTELRHGLTSLRDLVTLLNVTLTKHVEDAEAARRDSLEQKIDSLGSYLTGKDK